MTKALNVANAQIDMSNLNAGTYMVKVTADGLTKSIKVVKQVILRYFFKSHLFGGFFFSFAKKYKMINKYIAVLTVYCLLSILLAKICHQLTLYKPVWRVMVNVRILRCIIRL